VLPWAELWNAFGVKKSTFDLGNDDLGYRSFGIHILGSPTASDITSSIEGSRLLSNPKGWEKVAGGRSEAETSGKQLIRFAPRRGARGFLTMRLGCAVPWDSGGFLHPCGVPGSFDGCVPVVFDHRLLSRSPHGLPQTKVIARQARANKLYLL
jgi:hypothetical protein